MRVLFLTPDLPLPADQGAKLRNVALIRAAAAHHQVDLVSFARDDEAAVPGELEALCQRVSAVPVPPVRPGWRRGWDLVFNQLPDLALRLESPIYAEALSEALSAQRYDVVQIEGLEMIPYLPVVRSLAPRSGVIYDAHNAEMSLQRSMLQVEFRNPLRWHTGLYSFFQWSKLGTYERIMMNDTDMVLVVSEGDAAKLKGRHVEPKLVPNGADVANFPFRAPSSEPGRTLFFAGPMDYRPNADAIRWFVSAVFPRLRAALPEVRLRLVGRGTERVQGEGIETLGYVQDFGAELARADALVAPLRMGGGTRFKVLEAMAAGVPVVSTRIGLAGIAAEPEHHALVADSAADFAAAAVRILRDRSLAQGLARAARALVEGRYAWGKLTPNYLRLLADARKLGRSG